MTSHFHSSPIHKMHRPATGNGGHGTQQSQFNPRALNLISVLHFCELHGPSIVFTSTASPISTLQPSHSTSHDYSRSWGMTDSQQPSSTTSSSSRQTTGCQACRPAFPTKRNGQSTQELLDAILIGIQQYPDLGDAAFQNACEKQQVEVQDDSLHIPTCNEHDKKRSVGLGFTGSTSRREPDRYHPPELQAFHSLTSDIGTSLQVQGARYPPSDSWLFSVIRQACVRALSSEVAPERDGGTVIFTFYIKLPSTTTNGKENVQMSIKDGYRPSSAGSTRPRRTSMLGTESISHDTVEIYALSHQFLLADPTARGGRRLYSLLWIQSHFGGHFMRHSETVRKAFVQIEGRLKKLVNARNLGLRRLSDEPTSSVDHDTTRGLETSMSTSDLRSRPFRGFGRTSETDLNDRDTTGSHRGPADALGSSGFAVPSDRSITPLASGRYAFGGYRFRAKNQMPPPAHLTSAPSRAGPSLVTLTNSEILFVLLHVHFERILFRTSRLKRGHMPDFGLYATAGPVPRPLATEVQKQRRLSDGTGERVSALEHVLDLASFLTPVDWRMLLLHILSGSTLVILTRKREWFDMVANVLMKLLPPNIKSKWCGNGNYDRSQLLIGLEDRVHFPETELRLAESSFFVMECCHLWNGLDSRDDLDEQQSRRLREEDAPPQPNTTNESLYAAIARESMQHFQGQSGRNGLARYHSVERLHVAPFQIRMRSSYLKNCTVNVFGVPYHDKIRLEKLEESQEEMRSPVSMNSGWIQQSTALLASRLPFGTGIGKETEQSTMDLEYSWARPNDVPELLTSPTGNRSRNNAGGGTPSSASGMRITHRPHLNSSRGDISNQDVSRPGSSGSETTAQLSSSVNSIRSIPASIIGFGTWSIKKIKEAYTFPGQKPSQTSSSRASFRGHWGLRGGKETLHFGCKQGEPKPSVLVERLLVTIERFIQRFFERGIITVTRWVETGKAMDEHLEFLLTMWRRDALVMYQFSEMLKKIGGEDMSHLIINLARHLVLFSCGPIEHGGSYATKNVGLDLISLSKRTFSYIANRPKAKGMDVSGSSSPRAWNVRQGDDRSPYASPSSYRSNDMPFPRSFQSDTSFGTRMITTPILRTVEPRYHQHSSLTQSPGLNSVELLSSSSSSSITFPSKVDTNRRESILSESARVGPLEISPSIQQRNSKVRLMSSAAPSVALAQSYTIYTRPSWRPTDARTRNSPYQKPVTAGALKTVASSYNNGLTQPSHTPSSPIRNQVPRVGSSDTHSMDTSSDICHDFPPEQPPKPPCVERRSLLQNIWPQDWMVLECFAKG